MRKRTKKLTLHRETLRNLQADVLRRVAGRGETYEILTTCACTDTCDTTPNQTCGCGGGTEETCPSREIWSACNAPNC